MKAATDLGPPSVFPVRCFIGSFRWRAAFALRLRDRLRHACHAEDLIGIWNDGEVAVRSRFLLRRRGAGTHQRDGAWLTLNDWNVPGYKFGPILISFSASALSGRTFMVYHRAPPDVPQERYIFVEGSADDPFFREAGRKWPGLEPDDIFSQEDRGGAFRRKPDARYNVIASRPVRLDHAEAIEAVAHPTCHYKGCSRWSVTGDRMRLRQLASNLLEEQLKSSPEWARHAESAQYKRFEKMFSNLGHVHLRFPESDDE